MKLNKFTAEQVATIVENLASKYDYSCTGYIEDNSFVRCFIESTVVGSSFVSEISATLGRCVLIGFDAHGIIISVCI